MPRKAYNVCADDKYCSGSGIFHSVNHHVQKDLDAQAEKVENDPHPIPAGATEEDMEIFEDFIRLNKGVTKPPHRNYAKNRAKAGKKRRK